MVQAKKVSISIPVSLLKEVDYLARSEETSRSQFIRDAVREYIEGRKRSYLRDSLRTGYEKMGSLNLNIAESCISAENESGEILLEDLTGGGDFAGT